MARCRVMNGSGHVTGNPECMVRRRLASEK